ncbi:MAG: hypothetical protein U0524_02490 [Candidatus Saccharimonadales bacterium]
MTKLNHDQPGIIQHGGFTVEFGPATDLSRGTALVFNTILIDEDVEKLYANGINAYVTQSENRDATRLFLTAEYAEQADLAVRENGSLTPASVRGLLKIISSENEIIEE